MAWQKWLGLGVLLFISGCASFTQVNLPSNEIRSQIADGKLIAKGDYVKVMTLEGKEMQFVVEDISDNRLVGDGVEVDITNIQYLSKGTPSVWTKATAYTSAFAIGFFGIAAIGALIGALLL